MREANLFLTPGEGDRIEETEITRVQVSAARPAVYGVVYVTKTSVTSNAPASPASV